METARSYLPRGSIRSVTTLQVPDPEEQDWFNFRVTAQQTANDLGPAFTAFARTLDKGDMAEDALALAAERVAALARSVARNATGSGNPSAVETRPFRRTSAQFIADAWVIGGREAVEGFDVDKVALTMANAFRASDRDSVSTTQAFPGDDASMAMTSASVSFALVRPVMTYDFRRDPATLIDDMRSAVEEMAAEATLAVLPADIRPQDRRSVFQTYANRFADIMAAAYERKARQTVFYLKDQSEEARAAWCRCNDPMPEILESFRSWSVILAGTTLAMARKATGLTDSPSAETGVAPR